MNIVESVRVKLMMWCVQLYDGHLMVIRWLQPLRLSGELLPFGRCVARRRTRTDITVLTVVPTVTADRRKPSALLFSASVIILRPLYHAPIFNLNGLACKGRKVCAMSVDKRS